MRGLNNELGRLYARFFIWIDALPDDKRNEIIAIWHRLDAKKTEGAAKDAARLKWIDECVRHGFVKP